MKANFVCHPFCSKFFLMMSFVIHTRWSDLFHFLYWTTHLRANSVSEHTWLNYLVTVLREGYFLLAIAPLQVYMIFYFSLIVYHRHLFAPLVEKLPITIICSIGYLVVWLETRDNIIRWHGGDLALIRSPCREVIISVAVYYNKKQKCVKWCLGENVYT